jgi:hypothetical protein
MPSAAPQAAVRNTPCGFAAFHGSDERAFSEFFQGCGQCPDGLFPPSGENRSAAGFRDDLSRASVLKADDRETMSEGLENDHSSPFKTGKQEQIALAHLF